MPGPTVLIVETAAGEKCPLDFLGETSDLVYFMSFAYSARFGADHPLARAATVLRHKLGIDLAPLLTFGDATSTTLSGPFPRTATHAYGSPGPFTATATGTVNCTGVATATVNIVSPPPLTVSVSASTTPAPAQVSQIQSVLVPITYVFTTNIPANLTLTSPGGTFVSGGGDTLGTGGGGLSVNIVAGRGVVSETLVVPQVVAERSLHGGSPTFNFQRVFSGNNLSVTAAIPMRVVSSAVGPFSLRRVELRFENGRGEITIPKDFEKLKLFV